MEDRVHQGHHAAHPEGTGAQEEGVENEFIALSNTLGEEGTMVVMASYAFYAENAVFRALVFVKFAGLAV